MDLISGWCWVQSVVQPRPANCTVFDGTVPYFDPCTVCTVQDTKCTVFFAKIIPDIFQNVGLKIRNRTS